MKIPDKIKVGGHLYVVKFPYEFSERGDICGQQDGHSLEIKISNKDSWSHQDRPESAIAATFLHEVVHAVDNMTGHGVFKDKEGAIDGFSEMLFQVLRDNKLHFDDET